MKQFTKMGRVVLALLFVAALAQLLFNFASASVDRQQPPPDSSRGSLRTASDSLPPADLAPLAPDPTEYLYGTAQTCTYTITNPANSIDGAFNNAVASASGTWGDATTNAWTFTAIQDTILVPTNVMAEYRFYQSGWSNDSFAVAVYDGSSWTTLATFSSGNPPPTTLTTVSYNATATLNTMAKINAAQMRFRGVSKTGSADTIIIYVDGVRLVVTGTIAPGTLKQAHYRIGNDKPLAAMTWKGGVDQNAINIRRNTNFRVRFQVYNDGGQAKNWKPRLDWSAISGSGYAAVPTTSGAAPFFVNDTTQFANGDNISTTYFGCGTGTGTAATGKAYDTENPASSAISLPNGYYTEIEFNIQANDNASYNSTYYFRLTDNGTAFDAYTVTEAVLRIQLQPSASDPHNTYLATTDKCASCHRTHVGSGAYLRKASTEESVCYSCHNGTGATTNIQAQFNKTYKHPVASQSGIHQPGESAPANFSGSNRHVECEDCHTPHSRYPGGHALGNNAVSLVIEGASGLSVTNGAAWTTPTFTFVSSASYEYETCFKCHTSWSGATTRSYPSYPSMNLTDQSVEFNPANRAHHAVEAKGNNQSTNANYLQTFVSPITPSSTIYCSDCHGSETVTDPAGAHGSNNKSLKAGSSADSAIVCLKCHRADVYYGSAPANASLSRVSHPISSQHILNTDNVWGIYCLNCHGGATAGGIHGTHAGVGSAGTAALGEHFMNGAAITGFTAGTGGVSNSGGCWTKSSADSVNSCTKGHAGINFTPNYDY